VYHASGVIDGSGAWSSLDYAIEAAGGTYHEAAVGEVKNLVAFGAASALTGTYSPGGTFAEGQASIIAALVLPATDLVDAPEPYGVNLAGFEAYYLEGTGLNATTVAAAILAIFLRRWERGHGLRQSETLGLQTWTRQ
jgi:hypothetical protein